MTLQWMAISLFLYGEIIVTLVLLLPFLKPSLWKRMFTFRLFSSIKPIWTTTFYVALVILIFLFADAIRQMVKYSKPEAATVVSFDSKIDRLFKECRGQRNFYITGFSLFLMLIIRRLSSIISDYASLDANYKAVLKQASNANAELTRRMESEEKAGKKTGPVSKEEYEAMQTELKKSRTDLETLKKQAEATNSEYDRLSSEYQNLQNELQASKTKEDKKEL